MSKQTEEFIFALNKLAQDKGIKKWFFCLEDGKNNQVIAVQGKKPFLQRVVNNFNKEMDLQAKEGAK